MSLIELETRVIEMVGVFQSKLEKKKKKKNRNNDYSFDTESLKFIQWVSMSRPYVMSVKLCDWRQNLVSRRCIILVNIILVVNNRISYWLMTNIIGYPCCVTPPRY